MHHPGRQKPRATRYPAPKSRGHAGRRVDCSGTFCELPVFIALVDVSASAGGIPISGCPFNAFAYATVNYNVTGLKSHNWPIKYA
jgi:hypothetical protein